MPGVPGASYRKPSAATRFVQHAGVCLVLFCADASSSRANPEVKEHEIARFLLLKTSCVLSELKRANPGETPPRFHATCKNVANWPDGLSIECPEHDDDRSCRAMTPERHFKHLDALRQKHD